MFRDFHREIIMKKTLLYITVLCLLLSCSGSGTRYKNPYLPNYNFSMVVNLNLPTYSALTSPVNPKIITEPNTAVNIIVMKISDTDYRAWDANCPNQYPSGCSLMAIDGVNAVCGCDDIEYSIFTGSGNGGEYPMKPYRVQVVDSRTLKIFN